MNWNSIKIDEKLFAIRIVRPKQPPNHDQDVITLWLSDFRYIYKEHLRTTELLARSKSENPIVEYEPHIVLDTILHGDAQQRSLVPDENDTTKFRLNCKYYVSQLPFRFHWQLVKQSADVFFEEITKLLLGHMLDSHAQRTHLLDVIQAKDAEISQYKLDGAELIRKQFSTTPFDRESFEMSDGTNDHVAFVSMIQRESDSLGLSRKSSKTLSMQTSPSGSNDQHPSKKRSLPSPSKSTKRLTKEMLARSKFMSGPNASIVYGDKGDDVDEDHDDNVRDSNSIGLKSANTPKKSHTNVPKIKTKLNL